MGASDGRGSAGFAPHEPRSFEAVLADRRDRRRPAAIAPIETIATPRTKREYESVGRESETVGQESETDEREYETVVAPRANGGQTGGPEWPPRR
jgi:hypothetical protein